MTFNFKNSYLTVNEVPKEKKEGKHLNDRGENGERKKKDRKKKGDEKRR